MTWMRGARRHWPEDIWDTAMAVLSCRKTVKKKKKGGGRREEPEHAEPGDAGADPTLLTGVVTATARAAAERWPRPASHGTVTAT